LFALVSFAVIAVAALDIAHGFYRAVAERKREIGVLRAVGASAADVQRLFLAEAALVGLAGGALGLLVARLGALAVDGSARRLLPDFPFRPESWFAFDWRIAAIALLCAVLACMAGALLPARAASKMDPAEALTTT
jgi:ABC-type antimicrobial peptide transport system permease subunit